MFTQSARRARSWWRANSRTANWIPFFAALPPCVVAMGRPGQRFVPVRSIDNQAELMRRRARELLAGQRTAALNALRGHLAEIGVVGPQGV